MQDHVPLNRRSFIAGSLAIVPAVWASRALAASVPDRLAFEVVRHGCVIGTHEVRFERTGSKLLAHIDVNMRVGFGPITFFRYHHQGVEQWQDGAFVSLQTDTNNNGEILSVAAQHTKAGVDIRTRDGKSMLAPPNALPLTHWNVGCMGSPLFNPQDGAILKETAICEGHDTVALADGQRVAATRYAMSGAAPIDDWYDGEKTWTALRAKVKDGSILDYRRTL